MAFSTDISIDDGTPTTYVYSQISLQDAKSIRRDATRPLGTPRSLIISHTTNGVGMSAVDRHLVRLNLVEEDTGSDDLATVSASAYMVLEVPRRIVTTAMIESMIEQQLDFFGTPANVAKILNSEP